MNLPAYHQTGTAATNVPAPPLLALPLLPLTAASALAQTVNPRRLLEEHGATMALSVAALFGLTLFVAAVALIYLAARRRLQMREAGLVAALNDVRHRLDRAETFLAIEPQLVISWGLRADGPEIEGDLSLIGEGAAVLDAASWLGAADANKLAARVVRLREAGEAFRMPATTLLMRHLEIEGRAIAGCAVVRLRDVSGDRLDNSRLHAARQRLETDLDAARALLDALPCPAWARDESARLVWTNLAYARAVEASDPAEATARGTELLESATREASAASRAQGEVFRARAAAVVAGWRRALDVVEVPQPSGASVGIAFDASELEAARIDLAEMMKAHARTLDQLSTAVAIFDRRKQLVFHNAAYRRLWALDEAFLDGHPSESEVLDRLRARRLLPEQADFRSWKEAHLNAYQLPDTAEQVWYLPNGRTLRTVINPNPQSGVTYLFDDVSERFHLESQFNAQTRVQRETLDTLKEGVAVFGTDGRLKLSNHAFAAFWRIDAAELDGKPHIDRIAELCGRISPDPEPWAALRMAVAGFHDQRTGLERRLGCKNGAIVDCAAAPLPDGATLLTFTDTTATVNVERALTERNQALLATEKLRNDFVHHFSYELRSPLTNIIGFSQLLAGGTVGPLNPKQGEYLDYVVKSSAALHAIINDILDLATIDTGALELNLKHVDVLETIRAAAEGVQDRLDDVPLHLQIVALPDIGGFRADGKRVRQVLFNLLSNAIGFSQPGQTVTLAALRRGDEIVFKVSDQGRGIPHDALAQVFDRFHSNVAGSRHRGVGLGLSIVKSFVELHQGRVLIDSAPGEGTTVTCIFPAQSESIRDAGKA